jgi:hypothetical protein
MKNNRMRARGLAIGLILVGVSCGDSGQNAGAGGDHRAPREPIPAGIDPHMVEWRSDGKLIASRDSLIKTPGYVVDSIFPPDEALRRFRAETPGEPVDRLAGGEASSDALMRKYWAALVAKDSAAIARLVMTRGEWAYLYLPHSIEFRSGMQPSAAWYLVEMASARGALRAGKVSERNARVSGTFCQSEASAGPAVIWSGCGVILTTGAARDSVVIASHVMEHGRTFKLVSLANPL